MSLACLISSLSASFENLQAELKNGECRFLAAPSATATDTFGFAGGSYAPRTTEFFPCTWTARKLDEKLVGNQSRATAGYEISVAQKSGGAEVVVKPSDRIELKMNLAGNQTQIFEIVSRVSQSNIFWTIYAIDIDDEN